MRQRYKNDNFEVLSVMSDHKLMIGTRDNLNTVTNYFEIMTFGAKILLNTSTVLMEKLLGVSISCLGIRVTSTKSHYIIYLYIRKILAKK
jgi:hypothetical protein